MRFSIVLLFSVFALSYAQDVLVDEETAAAVETEELNLDEMLDEVDQDIAAATSETGEEEAVAETNNDATESTEASDAAASTEAVSEEAAANSQQEEETAEQPIEQSGPLIDLLGHQLYSLQMIDETQAQLVPQYTNEALKGKQVVGLYFSADWCGPCRKFTPELVSFYEKMNNRRGHKDDFEIVWVSRCRDVQSYGQYFTHMKWLALPPEEAMGERGQWLSNKYKVKGIPSLVLLDDLGNVITTDARNKIPQDKGGIGFPWRNPLVTLYTTLFPRSLRLMVKGQVDTIKGKLVQRVKGLVGMKSKA